jgi:hypothetical protein
MVKSSVLVLMMLSLVAIGGCSKRSSPKNEKAAVVDHRIGESFEVDKLLITVTGFEERKQVGKAVGVTPEPYLSVAPAGQVFLGARYTMKNATAQAVETTGGGAPTLVDPSGKTYLPDPSASAHYTTEEPGDPNQKFSFNPKLDPGKEKRKGWVFAVSPSSAKEPGWKFILGDTHRVAVQVSEPKAAEPQAVALETKSEPASGFTIEIPRGSKVLLSTPAMHTYSLPLPGGLHEYNVSVTSDTASTLAEAAKKSVGPFGEKVADKKELAPGAYLVVMDPRGVLQEVHGWRKGKKGGVHAKCAGPAAQKDMLAKICESLRATN